MYFILGAIGGIGNTGSESLLPNEKVTALVRDSKKNQCKRLLLKFIVKQKIEVMPIPRKKWEENLRIVGFSNSTIKVS